MKELKLNEEQEKRLNEDIKATQELLILNNSPYKTLENLKGISPFTKNNKYESLYTFATEDMSTYFKEFTITDSFLTIGASGDQVINAINSGAKTIDVFDSNRLCRHAMYLKLAAIKGLSYEEFTEYYETFSPFLFVKLIEYLPEEEFMYWGTLYSMFGLSNIKSGEYIRDLLFTYKRLDKDIVKSINPYLIPQNYEKLKKTINEVSINYIDSDLYNLPSHLSNKTYDAINLSNIYEYLNYGNNTTHKKAQEYHDFILNSLYPHLNQNGSIMVSYLYAWSDKAHQEFQRLYKQTNGKVVGTGALSMPDFMVYYLPGLTTQNLSYHYLEEVFQNDPIEKIPTEHIQYGQSSDMSHDMALILRKK